MKKAISVVAVVLLMAITLCACGAANPILGTWTAEQDGVAIDFQFNDDGTGKIASMGIISIDFTYKIDGNTLSIEEDTDTPLFGDQDFTFEVKGNKLILTADGETVEFTKK